MRVKKEKRKVNIYCSDGSLIIGHIHINPGERIMDFINDGRETYIAVTDTKIRHSKRLRFLKPTSKANKDTIFLNKSIIKWLEETSS